MVGRTEYSPFDPVNLIPEMCSFFCEKKTTEWIKAFIKEQRTLPDEIEI